MRVSSRSLPVVRLLPLTFSSSLIFVSPPLIMARADESTPPPAAHTSAHAQAVDFNNRAVQAAQAGNFDEATSLMRQALARDPSDAQFRQNLGGMLTDWAMRQVKPGHLEDAIALLQQAMEYTPESPQTLLWLADLTYIVHNDTKTALALWKRAYLHVPDAKRQAVAQRIAQAERDQSIERTFRERMTEHFRLRFEGASDNEEAVRILERALEDAYARLVSTLGSTPPLLTVIVYTSQQFTRVTGRRDWALGLYDGRLRLRLDEVGTEWGQGVVVHELAHAFLAETYGPTIPTWVHEGFAQTQEPPMPMTDHQQQLLASITARTAWVPLKWLDRRFEQPSNFEDVERAYVQSRYVMQELITRAGLGRVQAWFRRLADGQPLEQAFDQALAPLRWARVDQGAFE